MQQHGSKFLHADPLLLHDPRVRGQKIKKNLFYQNMVRLHIKLKEIMYAATW